MLLMTLRKMRIRWRVRMQMTTMSPPFQRTSLHTKMYHQYKESKKIKPYRKRGPAEPPMTAMIINTIKAALPSQLNNWIKTVVTKNHRLIIVQGRLIWINAGKCKISSSEASRTMQARMIWVITSMIHMIIHNRWETVLTIIKIMRNTVSKEESLQFTRITETSRIQRIWTCIIRLVLVICLNQCYQQLAPQVSLVTLLV